MEKRIFKVFVILVNLIQLTLVIMVGLYTHCLIELFFLSLIFWSLRFIFKVKHFSVLICTLLTLSYYYLSGNIIKEFPTIKFLPLMLGIFLIVMMNYLRKK
jgi:hypothetical protein